MRSVLRRSTRPVLQEAQNHTVDGQPGECLHRAKQAIHFGLSAHRETGGFAQHDSRRCFDAGDDLPHQSNIRGQAADFEVPHDLEAVGTSGFGFMGILQGGDDHLE